jgi:hypothetical protein
VDEALRPVAHARVEILTGPSVGTWATTDGEGTYELLGVVPGDVVIRVSKVGYRAADQPAQIEPGENRQSLLLQLVPHSAASARCGEPLWSETKCESCGVAVFAV